MHASGAQKFAACPSEEMDGSSARDGGRPDQPMPPPFPRAAVAIAVLPILTDGLSESVIFSFLPYMIADFGYDDVGYYSGLLGSRLALWPRKKHILWQDIVKTDAR